MFTKGTIEDYKLAWSALCKLASEVELDSVSNRFKIDTMQWEGGGPPMWVIESDPANLVTITLDEFNALLRLGVVKEGQVY
jgi:hypothetical protein